MAQNDLLSVGLEIARLRKAQGLTQQDLSARSGIARSTLARLEVGQLNEFGLRKLLAVLAALGSTLSIRDGVQGGSTLDDLRRERERPGGAAT